MCMDGINKVPKCRYGEKNCYFAREIRDHTKQTADYVMLNMGEPVRPSPLTYAARTER